MGATGLEAAELAGVRVAPAAADVTRVWPPCWRVEAVADGWQKLSLASEAAPTDGLQEGTG